MSRFADKTVLVTGAASGMGLSATRRFLDEGARVAMLDIDEASLREAAAQFPQDRILVHAGDTADKEVAAAAVKATVERFGGLNVLINNAGVASEGDIMHTSEADFERVMAVMLPATSTWPKRPCPNSSKRAGRSS